VADKKSTRPPVTEPLETLIHVDRHRVGRGRDRYMLVEVDRRYQLNVCYLGFGLPDCPITSIGIFGEAKIVTGRLRRI
jgi:hypothetical protein